MTRPAVMSVCLSGKVGYPSRGEARAALRVLKAKRQGRAGRKVEQDAYRCPVCSCWHVTSKPL